MIRSTTIRIGPNIGASEDVRHARDYMRQTSARDGHRVRDFQQFQEVRMALSVVRGPSLRLADDVMDDDEG